MKPQPYFLFTHSPLHVGAGSSVGYVDLPIQREVHTRIPIVPGSSLKGVLRAEFRDSEHLVKLFGSGDKDGKKFRAGSLLIGEARVLCFPVRSAQGAFAWITCPLVLERFRRDTGLVGNKVNFAFSSQDTDKILASIELHIVDKRAVVLEEQTFEVLPNRQEDLEAVANALVQLLDDKLWTELLGKRLAIVSDTVFCHFVQTACPVQTHVRIDDATGTADDGGLFNEEVVPSETLFYGMLGAQTIGKDDEQIEGNSALEKLDEKLKSNGLLQIGGGETTGLGWCRMSMRPNAE